MEAQQNYTYSYTVHIVIQYTFYIKVCVEGEAQQKSRFCPLMMPTAYCGRRPPPDISAQYPISLYMCHLLNIY